MLCRVPISGPHTPCALCRHTDPYAQSWGSALIPFVSPIFSKKTKCIYVCQDLFSYISDIEVNIETISRKKRKIIRDLHLILETKAPNIHKQSTGGCVRLAPATSSQRLHSSFIFLSNIVYNKGEHMSYSAIVGKVWMQRLDMERLTGWLR
jgi:hypothetical protein